MRKVMQIFGDKDAIVQRAERVCPDAFFRIEGSDLDYTLDFEEVTQAESEALYEEFADDCYGDGELSMAGTLVALLEDSGVNIATAESCTGGLIAAEIVGVPGASEVFYEGLVTYNNNAKMDRLGVSPETLMSFGAVSEETAIEMANGLLDSNVAIGVSTTGIAGPQGGTNEKPVGLVYIAVVSENKTEVYKNVFGGSRNTVRRKARNAAMFYAIQHIKNYY